VRLRSPRLPKFLDEVILRNLHVGDSSVDISVRRDGENVSLSILKARGNIEVSVFAFLANFSIGTLLPRAGLRSFDFDDGIQACRGDARIDALGPAAPRVCRPAGSWKLVRYAVVAP